MAVTRIPLDRGAAVYLRDETWWLYLRQAGRTIRKSLETRDRQHALTIGRELASAAVSGRWKVTASGISLRTVADRYTSEESKVHHSANTQKLLKYFWADFLPWCDSRNIRTLDELRREHVEAFLIRKPSARQTCERLLSRFCLKGIRNPLRLPHLKTNRSMRDGNEGRREGETGSGHADSGRCL